MNYLAHILLSGENKDIQLGNLVADGIKGIQYKDYPKNIKIGIILHRNIDAFTDNHPIFRNSTARLKPHFGRYSGVVVDIFYDHFLSHHWASFSKTDRTLFIKSFYNHLKKKQIFFPKDIQTFIAHLISNDWLASYYELEHLNIIFLQMNQRPRIRTNIAHAVEVLKAHYSDFEYEFLSFFHEIREYSKNRLVSLKNTMT